MKNPKDNFFKGRLRSLKFAIRGALLLIATEHSIMVQFTIATVMTILGFVMKISATEWMFQFLAIGLVLVAESLNTAIEKLSDFVHPAYHKRIGFIKDISAGAATFAAIIAIIIGLIIYIPKFS
ncbi:diacylglycerol kinase family protein [Aureibaculum sp. 2210JD6-5]|uniref:diacylglycerol kinase family protein n=1 Tax=Aureibaculum sp. 2210JD6-5 TaxID=3103957 RepID=UPI002AADF772|nr:diacylglycerol kinase family protein [Aureibaculum sp. 2210JD6-5]MDY7396139.1 diacylglycerol kinase family protein [Aureibaculum sp. 2210JD6-5]